MPAKASLSDVGHIRSRKSNILYARRSKSEQRGADKNLNLEFLIRPQKEISPRAVEYSRVQLSDCGKPHVTKYRKLLILVSYLRRVDDTAIA